MATPRHHQTGWARRCHSRDLHTALWQLDGALAKRPVGEQYDAATTDVRLLRGVCMCVSVWAALLGHTFRPACDWGTTQPSNRTMWGSSCRLCQNENDAGQHE